MNIAGWIVLIIIIMFIILLFASVYSDMVGRFRLIKAIGGCFLIFLILGSTCTCAFALLPNSPLNEWFDSLFHQPPSAIGAHLNEYLNICPNQSDQSGNFGNPYITGKIVVVDKANGRIADVNANGSLSAIRADDSKEVRTIICLYYRKETVGEYTDGRAAVQGFTDILVFNKTTSTMVGGTTIAGPAAPSFVSDPCNLNCGYGGDVSEDDIAKNILSLPKH